MRKRNKGARESRRSSTVKSEGSWNELGLLGVFMVYKDMVYRNPQAPLLRCVLAATVFNLVSDRTGRGTRAVFSDRRDGVEAFGHVCFRCRNTGQGRQKGGTTIYSGIQSPQSWRNPIIQPGAPLYSQKHRLRAIAEGSEEWAALLRCCITRTFFPQSDE